MNNSLAGCKNQKKYNSYKSNTSKEVNRINTNSPDYKKNFLTKKDEIHIKFGTGEIKSNMIRDDICIGHGDNKICLENFLFLSAFDMSENPFSEVEFDGILGLGFPELSTSKESNFLQNLLNSKKITNKIFAFFFRKNFFPFKYDKKIYNKYNMEYKYEKKYENKLSELVIGGIDFNRIKGEIYFNEIISKKYWEVKLDNIYYGRTKLPYCNKVDCTAIIDTGTSTLGVSNEFLRIFKKLSKLEKDCSNLKTLRPLIFEIGGVFYQLDAKDYVLKFKINGIKDFEYMVPDDEVEEKYLIFKLNLNYFYNLVLYVH